MSSCFRVVCCLSLVVGLSFALNAQTLLHQLGNGVGGEFGAALAAGPDGDFDGLGDLLVGAPQLIGTGGNRGTVRLVSALSGAVMSTWSGAAGFSDTYGHAIAMLPDVDGDGMRDCVVGGSTYFDLRSGPLGYLIYRRLVSGSPESFSFVDDIDGDLVPDVAVGIPGATLGAAGGGVVEVFSSVSAVRLFQQVGSQTNGRVGSSVAGGAGTLVVGSSGFLDASSMAVGRVEVFDLPGFSTRWARTGAIDADYGHAVAVLFDVTGDGVDDIVVSSPRRSNSLTEAGAISLLNGVSGAVVWTAFGALAFEHLGQSVAAMGDQNGDGLADVVVGGEGVVHILSGASGAVLVTWTGAAASRFGRSLAVLDDHTGDGVSELSVGAPLAANPGTALGRVDVYATELLPMAQITLLGGGCGVPSAPIMSLTAPPRLGTAFNIDFTGMPAGATIFLRLTVGAPVPLSMPPCVWWLDLATFQNWSTLLLTADASGSAVAPVMLPPDPLVAGLPLTMQAFAPEPLAPLGVVVTNGLATILGY